MLRQAQHERIWLGELMPHPAAMPAQINGIEVTFFPGALTFTIDGAVPVIPRFISACRKNGLWRTTCFEMFVKVPGEAHYFEFNFSPSSAWAAYRFNAYRTGMSNLPMAAPLIVPIEHGIRITFDPAALPPPPWRLNLTAVIEETDGTKSYWALAHPDGPPDFHDPACFVLELPAADRA